MLFIVELRAVIRKQIDIIMQLVPLRMSRR
jgi:hypothetical protein